MGNAESDGAVASSILRGRRILASLRSREAAARFRAAQIELEMVLEEAEKGAPNLLDAWLVQHQQFNAWEADPTVTNEPREAGEPGVIRRELPHLVPPPPASLSPPETPVAPRDPRPSKKARSLSPVVVERSKQTELPPSPSRPTVNAAAKSKSRVGQRTTKNLPRPRPQRQKRWLPSSWCGSILAHVIALIIASFSMIHIAIPPVPPAIIAMPAEAEELSMEAPAELIASEEETFDRSVPALPSFSSAADTLASQLDAIPLPTMMGESDAADWAPEGDAIQQATGEVRGSLSSLEGAQFFGAKAAGNSFCYVVDASPSMKKDNAFAAAKAELVRSLSTLKPQQRFHIAFFGFQVEPLTLDGPTPEAYPVYASPENLQKAVRWIERVRIQDRGLPPNDALEQAIALEPDGIFLLFDGDTKVDVAAFLRKANRSDDLISGDTPRVPIHTIGFYTQAFEGLMQRIASENRGTYRFVPRPNAPRSSPSK